MHYNDAAMKQFLKYFKGNSFVFVVQIYHLCLLCVSMLVKFNDTVNWQFYLKIAL